MYTAVYTTCRNAQFMEIISEHPSAHTVFDLISGLSAYEILGPKNRPN